MLSEMEKGVWLLSHIVVLCRLEARQTMSFCLSPEPLALMCGVSPHGSSGVVETFSKISSFSSRMGNTQRV